MTVVSPEPPRFSVDDAARLVRDHFGLEVSVLPLPADRDQNFRVETASGAAYVLKIANAAERRETLELQQAALAHIAGRDPGLGCPRLVACRSGETVVELAPGDGTPHFLRLFEWLPGVPLARVRPHTRELLRDLGGFLGRLTHALDGFDHRAAAEDFPWDLANADATIGRHLSAVPEAGRRALLEEIRAAFVERVAPALPGLRRSVIHGDANDYNVLVGEVDPDAPRVRRVTGLIDFGDLVRSQTVGEVAIGAAYAALGKPDPLGAAADVVAGYCTEHPLEEREVDLLFELVRARLAVSVATCARRADEVRENAYLAISEAPAWEVLEKLRETPPALAAATFRHAAGLAPCRRSATVVEWLKENAPLRSPLVEPDRLDQPALVFDLSVESTEGAVLDDPTDMGAWSRHLASRLAGAGARIGLGRYGEPRLAYAAPQFQSEGNERHEPRTVHLGLDLFMEAGAPVFAPLAGRLHAFANHDRPLDYGPTIVLAHETTGGEPFFTLYGHLSADSLEGLVVGKRVEPGDPIAAVGAPPGNGGWPPHVHFQLIVDELGLGAAFPGVAAPREWEIWSSLCPDPNLVARIDGAAPWEPGPPQDELRARRDRCVGPSLSVSYERPLTIVRGLMQYLFDEHGRPYLDAVNNVPHIGHSHPHVVKAAREQMAVLNTNTRYLHEKLVTYAERLTALLPEPLSVCYLVCSGSEANELALRLARAHAGADDVLVLASGYHGNTGTLIDVSSYKFDGPGGRGAPAHVHALPAPDPYRGPHRGPDSGPAYAEYVRAKLEELRAQGRSAGAFLAESVLGCAGQIVPPAGYLTEAYGHARAAGAVCIADEVQVGFGRVGTHFWGFELDGVVPDIVTLGKPIGNGHPLAAVVTTPAVAASFTTGMEFFSTFGGNPVSCAIGHAVLDVITAEGLQARARDVGGELKAGLAGLAGRHALVGDVRGAGLFLGVELVRDRATLEPAGREAAWVVERMKERGILLSTDGPLHNVIKVKPPLVFTAADARRLVGELDGVLGEDALRREVP